MKKIAIIVSSVGKNMELAHRLQDVATKLGQESELIDLVGINLPLYTSILEDEGIPQAAIDLTHKLQGFSGFIVVAPEYNGVMPPVLNNAVAWVSRSTDDFRSVFNQKFIALATHSGGGGIKVMEAMRLMFTYVGANVLSREIITNYTKAYKESSATSVVEELIKYT